MTGVEDLGELRHFYGTTPTVRRVLLHPQRPSKTALLLTVAER